MPKARFPYRGKLYEIEPAKDSKYIVLPDARVLVVCNWDGDYPKNLSDIRKGEEPPHEICKQLRNSILATEIEHHGSLEPMAILDYEGQRYAVSTECYWRSKAIEINSKYIKATSSYPGEPMRIAGTEDLVGDTLEYILKEWGSVKAYPQSKGYNGMANEPRDLRIIFPFRERTYVLSHEVYEKGIHNIYIPDQGFFFIQGFLESMPVKLGGLSLAPSIKNAVSAILIEEAVDIDRR